MSWKSLVSAGLLCVLASPVFAVPSVSRTTGGTVSSNFLNANGDWVWNIQISNTNPVPTGSSPLAAELGFTASTANAGLVSAATNLSTGAGDDFDTVNPGANIFGWEVDGAGIDDPEGVQSNLGLNQVFSALGSIDYNTVGPHDYIQIITRGPASGAGRSLSSTVALSGAYGGKGRIAELTGAATVANYDLNGGSVTLTAKPGDINLDGTISNADYSGLLSNYNQNAGTRKWNHGDFNGDGSVTNADYSALLGNYGPANNYTVVSGGFTNSGAGLGSGSAVPEPTSAVLLLVAGLLGVARRSRR